MTSPAIRLTEYSHGAGCGYKISPKVLDTILHSTHEKLIDPRLLVGNETRDDTAVYDIGNDVGIINTTDFFMSIVDDSFDFGCIAAPTPLAISTPWGQPDYGDRPSSAGRSPRCWRKWHSGWLMVAFRLPAGGHSIDAPEPIFGLAVTGVVNTARVKKNSTAQAGSTLFLTKPLGIGVLTVAEKKRQLRPEHQGLATEVMCWLNTPGVDLLRWWG